MLRSPLRAYRVSGCKAAELATSQGTGQLDPVDYRRTRSPHRAAVGFRRFTAGTRFGRNSSVSRLSSPVGQRRGSGSQPPRPDDRKYLGHRCRRCWHRRDSASAPGDGSPPRWACVRTRRTRGSRGAPQDARCRAERGQALISISARARHGHGTPEVYQTAPMTSRVPSASAADRIRWSNVTITRTPSRLAIPRCNASAARSGTSRPMPISSRSASR
jgi:hypothetical protein